jgi:hypothetical protein
VHADRRAAARQRLAFPVLIAGPRGLRRCIARDVSSRGLFVETPDAYPPGTAVRVTFALPDGSWEMSTRCLVRHVLRLDAGDGALHGMGLSFEDSDEEPANSGIGARREFA